MTGCPHDAAGAQRWVDPVRPPRQPFAAQPFPPCRSCQKRSCGFRLKDAGKLHSSAPILAFGSLQSRLVIARRIVIAQQAGPLRCGLPTRQCRTARAPELAVRCGHGGRQHRHLIRRHIPCDDDMPVAHCGMYGSQALHLRQYRCQPAALVHETAKFGKPGSLALHAGLPRNIFHHRLRRSGEHFEADRRYAVAEIFQRQFLEHGIGAAAIGRTSRADAGGHQRVGQLVGMAGMNAQHPSGLEVACRTAQQIAIRPDTAHAVDRPARQRHGERDGIGVTCRCRPALAAPAGFAPFAQVARPDNRARHADPAV